MSPDDVRREKADAVLALEEHEEKLAVLQHKAENLAATLNGFVLMLEQSPGRQILVLGQANHGHEVEVKDAACGQDFTLRGMFSL